MVAFQTSMKMLKKAKKKAENAVKIKSNSQNC